MLRFYLYIIYILTWKYLLEQFVCLCFSEADSQKSGDQSMCITAAQCARIFAITYVMPILQCSFDGAPLIIYN